LPSERTDAPCPAAGAAGHGFVARGYEPVAEAFARNLHERGDAGAAFCAMVDGRIVVDLWGGLADRARRRPWRRDTIAGIFSGTKGLVATCLVLLVERGALDLDAPVRAYWPEFGAAGKDDILVRHLVSHQAGLPGLATPVTLDDATDDRRMARLLAAQPAIHSPGARMYYHAMTFGWLCGELIRRVDGRSAGRMFDEEVARPLGLDAWIGLPAEEDSRVAVLERGDGFGAQRRDNNASRDIDELAWSIWANPPRFATDRLPGNTRSWRAAEVPASNGVASARALARLYGCLAHRGELDEVRLLRPASIDVATTCLSHGVEPYIEEPMAFGVGFELQTAAKPFGPPGAAFGHRGAGGSVHGAWPELRVGFSYVTNTLRETRGADARSDALMAALQRALDARAHGNDGAPKAAESA
jgi:CubicO group peptidase (beta-lactamase class C family)